MEGPQRYLELSRDVSDILQEIGRFLGGLVEGGSDGGYQLLLDQELSSYFQRFYQLKARHQDRALSCAVLALTKSGKSTLLNALLGAICLPSSNVPETARITRIIHTPLEDGKQPELTYQPSGGLDKRTIVGEYGIREHLRYLNREVRTRNHQASDEGFLDVRIPVAALETFEQDPAAVSLQLLDTPGPNEFGEEALKHQVERLLDGVDAVLYLLDYSKLKTAEEATLLGKLKDINPQLVSRLSQRLFFVVNKIDLTRTSEGLEPDEIKHYVANLVTSQLATEGFQLSPDQVLLLSAQDAMLSRLILRGKAGKEERLRFGKLAFGARKAATTPDEDYLQAATEMLQDSGLHELEERVLGFLYNNSGSLKLLSTLDDVQRLLHQVRNVAAASNAALQQDVKTLQEETEKLTAELEDVLEQFDVVQQEANQVEGEVVDEVRGRMQHLKEDLFEKVSAVLDCPDDSPNGQAALRAALAGRWKAALDKTARFWARQRDGSGAARDELQGRLRDLHQDIHATIDAEVRGFWAQLEAATNERQQAMFRMLNVHLARLGQRVETVVGDLLEVELEPVPLHLDPPTAQEFHTDLQQLFTAAISPREVARTREGTEEHLVWEKRTRRTGLCSWSDYYVARPEQRSITESYNETVFELRPEQVQGYFMKLVDETVEHSVKHVRTFVHQYLSARLNDARSQIEQYGSRYTEAMLHALETSKQGEDARLAGMQAVQEHLAEVTSLLDDTTLLQQRASGLLPATQQDEEALHSALMDALNGGAGAWEDAEGNVHFPLAGFGTKAAAGEQDMEDHAPTEAEHQGRVVSKEAGASGTAPEDHMEFADAYEELTHSFATVPFPAEGMALPSDVPACGGCADKDCPSTRPVPGQAVALPPHVEVAIVEAPGADDTVNNVEDDNAAEIDEELVDVATEEAVTTGYTRYRAGFADMKKWLALAGLSDSDEEEEVFCPCGVVHPPTFHEEWRGAAAREEGEAAAAAGAGADPGEEITMQEAALVRAPASEMLPTSSRDTPQTPVQGPQKAAASALSSPGSNMTMEHDAQPDGPAILPAEHVRPEDASEAGRDLQSHDSSDDWTIVSDTSKTGAEPEAH